MITMPIDWSLIGRAVEHYREQNFHYVETPWVVSMESLRVTYPAAEDTRHGHVGSAEQGFIELISQGRISPGRYVSASPCFRYEDEVRPDHGAWFFKVELIDILGDHIQMTESPDLQRRTEAIQAFQLSTAVHLLKCAEGFFKSEGTSPVVVPTDEGYDLELNGVEIGSYGLRQHQGFTWAYGTGVAEPRFSLAKTRRKEN